MNTKSEKSNKDNESVEAAVRTRFQSLEEELNDCKKHIQELENSTQDKEEEIRNLKQDTKKLQESFDSTFASKVDENEQLKAKYKENQRKLDNVQASLKRQIDDLEKQLSEERKTSEQLSKKAECEQKRLNNDLKIFKTKNAKLEKELSDTKSRLSMVIGDKVSNANPDVADLSDNHRPTKVGEMYQELYDNQWTDAFEALVECFQGEEDITRKKAIELLQDILQDTYRFCVEDIDRQNKVLVTIFGTKENNDDIPITLKKKVRDARGIHACRDAQKAYEKYMEQLKKNQDEEKLVCDVKPFVKECVAVSWLMAIQEPQVVFYTKATRLASFDGRLYRAYTVTGKKIDFVVWPALLLHRDGPTLTKGIVQCIKDSKENDDVTVPQDEKTLEEMSDMEIHRQDEKQNKEKELTVTSIPSITAIKKKEPVEKPQDFVSTGAGGSDFSKERSKHDTLWNTKHRL